ncbi:MAG TPA: methionine adenosyltransferase domain-containing protein [Candidatus Saccharibacteria bacterium]|nr:methionine adenosyltransferase domain-containing protein [Candidatus Saccharibacteria bacterium]
MSNYKTAESVSPKHPDKICDQISDAILDAHLSEDPFARVAIDVAGGHGVVFVTGEVTSLAKKVNVEKIVKRLAGKVQVIEHVAKQSPEIAQGVDSGGAGDQGIMVGYATNETPEMLPLECALSRHLNKYIYDVCPYDGKTQVTIKDGKIISLVASFQNIKKDDLLSIVKEWLKQEPLAKCSDKVKFHINPAGDWGIGGFDADAGLTGRKLVVDNYGPRIPIGGGAFSGKDPSKVDRSGAYMARRIAVDYLKQRKAKEVYVYLAYAIGHDQPLEATVLVDGNEERVEGYDLTPNGIINFLDMRKPQYEQLAAWGHFGNLSISKENAWQ